MKRSAQIGLVVMGVLGATTASGYYLSGRDPSCLANPPASAGSPGATVPGKVMPDPNCRRSRWWVSSWSGSQWGSRWSLWPTWSTQASTSTPATKLVSTTSAERSSTTAQRSGFGSSGRWLTSASS
jgi:hypothetical protein